MAFVNLKSFDILEKGGRYLTDSDALRGCGAYRTLCEESRRIPADSEEKRILWEKAFEHFVDTAGSGTRLIIVRNLLSERKGTLQAQQEYPETGDIRRMNRILDGYYRYIEKNHPEIPVISTADLPEYFTDEGYEYGALPQHLNEIVNQKIAGRIQHQLSAERTDIHKEGL